MRALAESLRAMRREDDEKYLAALEVAGEDVDKEGLAVRHVMDGVVRRLRQVASVHFTHSGHSRHGFDIENTKPVIDFLDDLKNSKGAMDALLAEPEEGMETGRIAKKAFAVGLTKLEAIVGKFFAEMRDDEKSHFCCLEESVRANMTRAGEKTILVEDGEGGANMSLWLWCASGMPFDPTKDGALAKDYIRRRLEMIMPMMIAMDGRHLAEIGKLAELISRSFGFDKGVVDGVLRKIVKIEVDRKHAIEKLTK